MDFFEQWRFAGIEPFSSMARLSFPRNTGRSDERSVDDVMPGSRFQTGFSLFWVSFSNRPSVSLGPTSNKVS